MLLEQDHFDEWMQRLMRRLEDLERACTARQDELPVAAPGERLLDNGDLRRMLNVSKRSLQRYERWVIFLIKCCTIIRPITRRRMYYTSSRRSSASSAHVKRPGRSESTPDSPCKHSIAPSNNIPACIILSRKVRLFCCVHIIDHVGRP